MNRSPTDNTARFSSLVPAPIHPMQARLLALVAAHRFATTTQLARLTALEYASSASALRQTQRHLASLAQQRLLTSLERRVGGWQGGSAVTIWAATTRVQRLVAVDKGEEVPRRQRPREVSTTFLDHLLAITEVRTSIEEAVRQEADTEAMVSLEPDCWRTALSPSGQVQVLRPDLAVTITSPAYEDRYLVEIDRATENPGRVIATCWRYQEHQAINQASDDGVFPLVVWLVPTDRRRHRLERAIAHSTGLLRDLFRVIRLDRLPTLIHGGPAAIPTPQASNQVGQ